MSFGEPRSIRPDDVPEVLEMVRELAEYERSLPEVVATETMIHAALFGERPAVFGHVVEAPAGEDKALAGFAIWFLNFSTWLGVHGVYLEDLYVRPRFRGHGLGRQLMREIARVCQQRGYGRFEWAVLDWNEPALGFYRSLGAEGMNEWTVYRLRGDALAKLAGES